MKPFHALLLTGCLAPWLALSAQAQPEVVTPAAEDYAIVNGHNDEVECDSSSAALADGRLENRGPHAAQHPWPTKILSIGHTIASYQNYVDGYGHRGDPAPTGPYFHCGVDVRTAPNQPIYAAAPGKVVTIENYSPGPLSWEVGIKDDEGFVWQYHHVDRKSIPKEIEAALKSGKRIETGTKLGNVVAWPVSGMGETFHHLHLNVRGANKEYLSPFSFLQPLDDKQAPIIKSVGILQGGKPSQSTTVSGEYSLCSEISDLVLHKKFIVPPHSITCEVDGGEPFTVWEFERLPGGSSPTKYVHDYFVRGYSKGNYDSRRFIINLGFKPGSKEQVFPTEAGQHTVVVKAKDYAGNTAEKTFEWTVQ